MGDELQKEFRRTKALRSKAARQREKEYREKLQVDVIETMKEIQMLTKEKKQRQKHINELQNALKSCESKLHRPNHTDTNKSIEDIHSSSDRTEESSESFQVCEYQLKGSHDSSLFSGNIGPSSVQDTLLYEILDTSSSIPVDKWLAGPSPTTDSQNNQMTETTAWTASRNYEKPSTSAAALACTDETSSSIHSVESPICGFQSYDNHLEQSLETMGSRIVSRSKRKKDKQYTYQKPPHPDPVEEEKRKRAIKAFQNRMRKKTYIVELESKIDNIKQQIVALKNTTFVLNSFSCIIFSTALRS
ncbi:hypothetical protein SK128_000223 [Halocaridina rubra]|uniref:BZIP domain-containing protein n=1 Tax=Halocaridina rubra TaxID=373956 RepID=A0AAN9A677_HALRR